MTRIITTNRITQFEALNRQIADTFPGMPFKTGAKSGGRVFADVSDDTDPAIAQQLQSLLDTFDETLDSNKLPEQLQREQLLADLAADLASAEGKLPVDLTDREQDAVIRALAFRLGAIGLDGRLRTVSEWLY